MGKSGKKGKSKNRQPSKPSNQSKPIAKDTAVELSQSQTLAIELQPKISLSEQPKTSDEVEPFQKKFRRFSEHNLFLGGLGVIITAIGFLVPGVILSGIALIAGGLMITVAIKRHNFFEGKAKLLQKFGNPCISVIIATVLAISWVFLQPKPVEQKLHAFLVADDKPSPPSKCPVPPDAIGVYIGNSTAWATKSSFNLLNIDGEIVLSFERASDGLFLNAILRDENGEVKAKIIKNVFSAYDNSDYDAQTPDANTVNVFDKKNDQIVLSVRYLNPKAIKVLGTFKRQNKEPVIINDELQGVAREGSSSGNCYSDLKVGALKFY